MTTSSSGTVTPTEPSFDVRWARWQEAGAAQDRALNRRAALFGALAFCAVAAWLAIAVYRH
jgi:hypothetical protein